MSRLVISILFCIFGLFFVINAVPLMKVGATSANITPGVFPMFLGILLTVASFIMIIINIISLFKYKFKANINFSIKKLIIIYVSIAAFIILWQIVNFFIALPLLILVLVKLFGIFTLKNYVIFTISFSLAIYLIFSVMLNLRF